MPAISRPLLIALAAAVAFVALWLVVLRPKPVAVQDTPLAPIHQISKAKQAVAASDAANAKIQAATGAATSKTAAPNAATPKSAPNAATPKAAAPKAATPKVAAAPKAATPNSAAAKSADPKAAAKPAHARSIGQARNAAVVRDVKHGKVVVLLFWNSDAADDIAARGALRDLDLHGGKVVVRVIPISRVAQYASVTSGVKIAQSPTTVIIGRNGHARVIMGLTEPREISQAVGDALARH